MGITARQFEDMRQRVRGGARVIPAVQRADAAAPAHEIVLGIDPSLRGTGYGVIVGNRAAARVLGCGTISCPSSWPGSRCLVKIAEELRAVIRQHQPTVCAIEGLFYAQNIQTALIMGQARGAALVAVAEFGLPIFEIAPRKVKQAIVGYGGAQKLAVAKMVQRMLQLAETPAADAADALALALAHTHDQNRLRLSPARMI